MLKRKLENYIDETEIGDFFVRHAFEKTVAMETAKMADLTYWYKIVPRHVLGKVTKLGGPNLSRSEIKRREN